MRNLFERRIDLEKIESDNVYQFVSLRIRLHAKDENKIWYEIDSKKTSNRRAVERITMPTFESFKNNHKSVSAFIDKKVKEGFTLRRNYLKKV